MKHVSDHIREHIHEQAGIVSRVRKPDLSLLQKSEWCGEFERAMRARLIMGALRYGTFSTPGSKAYDFLRSILVRVEEYRRTGNDELLVDIANYALLEYKFGTHPKKHWHATDDGMHASAK